MKGILHPAWGAIHSRALYTDNKTAALMTIEVTQQNMLITKTAALKTIEVRQENMLITKTAALMTIEVRQQDMLITKLLY